MADHVTKTRAGLVLIQVTEAEARWLLSALMTAEAQFRAERDDPAQGGFLHVLSGELATLLGM